MRKAIALPIFFCWIVSGSMVRTVDGDTFVASVDIWPGLTGTAMIRVLGVDTPEMRGETRPAAEKARDFTQAWLNKGDVTIAVGCQGQRSTDNFGRTLATVTRGDKNLADELIAAGLGVKR